MCCWSGRWDETAKARARPQGSLPHVNTYCEKALPMGERTFAETTLPRETKTAPPGIGRPTPPGDMTTPPGDTTTLPRCCSRFCTPCRGEDAPSSGHNPGSAVSCPVNRDEDGNWEGHVLPIRARPLTQTRHSYEIHDERERMSESP